ncbi:MAG: hypothetical protein LC541_04555 [Candidatus Thiodiazotropha sp.]|nr:hypothetical protein [Candidatus Thiodiazotropha sp.]MCM8882588.1 hypothetical protein [Candidatus Thiodiazotropha sp.]MCM8918779.1 hypothetical protein [Candidatus Thiodiazotropha sp.]
MTQTDIESWQYLEALLEMTRRYRKLSAVPLNPMEDLAVDWLKREIEMGQDLHQRNGGILCLYEETPGHWTIVENGGHIPVSYEGDALETIADIFLQGVGYYHLLDFAYTVASLRNTKKRVVERLENAGANITADYIQENLYIKGDKTITVKPDPYGTAFLVQRLNQEYL